MSQEFNVIIEQDHDGNFVAYVVATLPNLPERQNPTKSLDAIIDSICESPEFYLELINQPAARQNHGAAQRAHTDQRRASQTSHHRFIVGSN
jgi:predicted RNase H-like HicB family nuclease